MNRIKLVSIIAACFFVTPAFAQQVKSTRVIDGDTVAVNGRTIRIVGIDTPEILTRLLNKSSCPVMEKELGFKAKARVEGLLNLLQNKVTIKYHKGTDIWGRQLASLYSNGNSVAKILIDEGLALPWTDMKKARPVFCLPKMIRMNLKRG